MDPTVRTRLSLLYGAQMVFLLLASALFGSLSGFQSALWVGAAGIWVPFRLARANRPLLAAVVGALFTFTWCPVAARLFCLQRCDNFWGLLSLPLALSDLGVLVAVAVHRLKPGAATAFYERILGLTELPVSPPRG